MTEAEMCAVLGMLSEPVQNRVQLDAQYFQSELLGLQIAFLAVKDQKKVYGSLNPDIWCELMPWISVN